MSANMNQCPNILSVRAVQIVAVAAIFLSISKVNAKTASMEVFTPPTSVLSIHQTDPNGNIYGKFSLKASWHISHWNNPSGDIADFENGTAMNNSMKVSISAADPAKITIGQSGMSLPCQYGANPTEFDGFVGANTKQNNPSLPSAEGIAPSKPLDRFNSLIQQIDVKFISSQVLRNVSCNVSKAVGLVTLVLSDKSAKQTLFYQVLVIAFNTKPSAVWWAKGDQNGRYGYNDVYPSLAHEWTPGETHHIELDLLPKIIQLIKGNDLRMDTNLGNWDISGAYFGNAIYGKVEMRTQWSNYHLFAD